MANTSAVLIRNKFMDRYAKGSKGAEAIIESEVKSFMNRNKNKISSIDLQNLERKVERLIKNLKKDTSSEGEEKVSDVVLPNERSKKIASRDSEMTSPIPFSYLVFSEAMEYEHKRDKIQKQKKQRAKQLHMKRELDIQIQEIAGRGGEAKKSEEDYAHHVRKQHSEWKEQEVKKGKEELRKNLEIRRERDEQLRANQDRLQKAEKRKKEFEKKLIERAVGELNREEERRKQQIKDQRAYMVKVQTENARQKLIREEERKRLQEDDQRLQREYAAKLDQQERLRKETFEKMKEKSSNNQKMYIQATEERNRQEKADEEKARRLQQEKLEEGLRKLKEEGLKRQQDKRDMNRCLAEQLSIQRKREELLREEEAKFATAYKDEAVQAIQKQKAEAAARRRAALQHKKELQKQMEEKAKRPIDTDSSVMTDHEKRINMPKLREFASDSGMVEAINGKVRKALVAQEAKAAKRNGRDRQDDDCIY